MSLVSVTFLQFLTLSPVLLPLAAGLLLLCLPLSGRGRHVYIFLATLATAVVAVAGAFFPTGGTVTLWRVTATLSIALRLDLLARVFSILASGIWLPVTLYAEEYLRRRPPEERFFVFFLTSLGSVIGVACAANFLTLYLFYELMTFMTLPLVMHSQQREAIRGTVKYLFYSLAGAALALGGFCFFQVYGVSTEFTPGGVLHMAKIAQDAGGREIMLMVTFLTLLGFGAKAGLVPLHSWLPTAHPVAPTPASAVLSGLITKGGVVGMLRVVYFIAGPDFLRGTWVQRAMMGLALLTIFVGSMMAYVEKHLKKRIAWSSVSQVSYVVFGMMLLTPEGLVGALLQLVAHALAKSCLFLSAGVVIYFTLQGANYHYADQLRGVGKELPITMTCFALASVSLIGLPATGGFVAKWFLISGALGLGMAGYVGIAVLMVSALLTAGYLLPIVTDAFFPGEDYDYTAIVRFHLPLDMRLPLLALSVGSLLSGVFAGPLARWFRLLAATLF
ncbi:MAG: hypothetical protein IJU98_05195 [Synergistaceae bacterium]|nr:hypothetical protein [Synergistaceae bacterium]